jgi:spoIIIJ-associated protein
MTEPTGSSAPQAAAGKADEPQDDETEAAARAGAAPDLEAQRDTVETFLRGVMQAFGREDAALRVDTADEGTVVADIKGDRLGLLVGPKGQTLQALHELTRSVIQRQYPGQTHARLHLDIGGYRERRKDALGRFTRDVAEEVLRSRRSKVLDPMSAADRKIVHDVVNEIDGVRTLSEGDEPERRVIIEIADEPSA